MYRSSELLQSRHSDLNREPVAYKATALPIELWRLIRDIPKKGGLNETKKERTPRTTVYGSHFAEYRKLCNGIAVSRTRTTFFVGQISNLLRYHYATIPFWRLKFFTCSKIRPKCKVVLVRGYFSFCFLRLPTSYSHTLFSRLRLIRKRNFATQESSLAWTIQCLQIF